MPALLAVLTLWGAVSGRRRRAGGWLRVCGLLLVALVSGLVYNRSQASAPLRLSDLPPVVPEAAHRLLVIAPHPDDETLGAGGLIQGVLAAGGEVRVLVLTNGDGQWAAPLALHGRVRPRPEDYVAMGFTRQAEAREAAQRLGLPAEAISFLGYPDGGLSHLWLDDWTTACPYLARLTRTTVSPYAGREEPADDYCGRTLLNRLISSIAAFGPDVVVLPHPHDDHPDHRAASAFARLALALAHQETPGEAPALWGYLVHHGAFPQPRGLRPASALLPPADLVLPGSEWHRYDLTSEHVRAKTAALRAYQSQERLLGAFLPSFVRRNELFDVLPLSDGARLEWNALPDLGPLAWHTIEEPAREDSSRLLLEGADLVALEAARVGDHLWLSGVTRGRLLPGLRYQLLVKTPAGQTLQLQLPETATRLGPARFSVVLDLAELGDPAVLAVTAEVRQGPTLDRTAWQLLALGPPAGQADRVLAP